ncbi:chromatin assembly factor 1 subunit A-domain-containing protein [Phycomyces blakesleeanus]|uniref:Chromatin assembly factor 1 subunit A-domain-containing protein n=1 Tax=Phycomyces blakesleeanus TaxID=4837 RepID=A0ABR3AY48_PHYBL
MKLLHFPEDVRPAYYGTWTKSSQSISGRTPFARDEKLVDYEHDSEAEWEPEGEGEDIQSGDEDEEDFGADTVDPEDASWLVPEGYVSDSERINSDEEDGYSEQESKGTGHSLPLRPPTRKIIGPYFENDSDTSDEETLRPYKTKMCIDVEEGYDPFAVLDGTNSSNGAKTSSFVKEHTDALISVILSKPGNMKLLVSEAKSHEALKDISRRHIESKIKEIAVKEKRGKDTKAIWHIK